MKDPSFTDVGRWGQTPDAPQGEVFRGQIQTRRVGALTQRDLEGLPEETDQLYDEHDPHFEERITVVQDLKRAQRAAIACGRAVDEVAFFHYADDLEALEL